MKETFSKLKEFFRQKNTVVDREEGSDDYTVKQNKKADIIIRIFSILAAIIIWIYAVSTDGAIKTTDYQFTNNDITIKKVQKSDAGIVLQSFNPHYAPLFFTHSDIENLPVKIIGIVKQLRREF